MSALTVSARLAALSTVARDFTTDDALINRIEAQSGALLGDIDKKTDGAAPAKKPEQTAETFIDQAVAGIVSKSMGVSPEAVFLALDEEAARVAGDAGRMAETVAPADPESVPASVPGSSEAWDPSKRTAAADPVSAVLSELANARQGPRSEAELDVIRTEAEQLIRAIEKASGGDSVGVSDARLAALSQALQSVGNLTAQASPDTQIDALFAKVDAAGSGDNAGGRPDRFESFGADRKESFAAANSGYAASRVATSEGASRAFTSGA